MKAFTSERGALPIGSYSSAVEAGGLVFLAGQTPRDRDNVRHGDKPFAVQARMTLDNLEAAAGLAECYLAAGDAVHARLVLDQVPADKAADPILAPVRTRLKLQEELSALGDSAALEAALTADPDDHQARFDLALIALMEAHPAPDDALAALRAAGVDYLLVNEGNIRYRLRFDPDGRLRQAQAAFARLTPLLEPIYSDGPENKPSIVIYRIPAGAAAAGR